MLDMIRETIFREYYDRIDNFAGLVFRVERDVKEFTDWITRNKDKVYSLLERIPSTIDGDQIVYSVNNLIFSINKIFDGEYSLILELEPPVHPVLQLVAGLVYLEKKYYPVLYIRTEPTVSNILVFVKFDDLRKASITAVGIPLTLLEELASLRTSIFPVKYPLSDETDLEKMDFFYLTEVGYTLFKPVNTSVSVEIRLDVEEPIVDMRLSSNLRQDLVKVLEK